MLKSNAKWFYDSKEKNCSKKFSLKENNGEYWLIQPKGDNGSGLIIFKNS
jgi:hypothetical protein